MQKILNIMSTRVRQLNKAIKRAGNEQSTFPPGRLRISRNGNRIRYYNVLDKDDKEGAYLTKKNKNLIPLLAQKSYNKHFIKTAEQELSLLENALAKLSNSNADTVYQRLSPTRQSLVTPYIKTEEMIVQEWNAMPYRSSTYMEEDKRYDTRRGEKVRSKSEAILADMFYELGIPYRYEQELRLNDGQVKYPDFTLLKVKTQEVIYLEHLGLLDNEEYRKNNLKKLDDYRDSGIYLGKNLLITYETIDSPLDIRGIKKMLKAIFCTD